MGERVGFIGLGTMGAPMARNLLRAGFPVLAFDVATANVDALLAHGATAAPDPAAVARPRAGSRAA